MSTVLYNLFELLLLRSLAAAAAVGKTLDGRYGRVMEGRGKRAKMEVYARSEGGFLD